MTKQKIRLAEEKETLLIPLFSKAFESKRTHPILLDAKAEEILESIDYNFDELRIPRQTLITLAMRANRLDGYVREYLEQCDHPLVIHLGCGLDSRVLRVGARKAAWYDLDYPDVIELRRKFYEESDHYHMIPSSVTDPNWLGQLKEHDTACIVAEGLLMYLHEDEVRKLFLDLQAHFSSCEMAFDVYSSLTAKSANNHPSIKKTGARLHWGIDSSEEITTWNNGIRLLEEWCFTDSEDIANLDFGDRLLFRIMGGFQAARQAHRILRFQFTQV